MKSLVFLERQEKPSSTDFVAVQGWKAGMRLEGKRL